MLELLQYSFGVNALAGGVLVGLLGSYYGVFVVQRGLSFMGAGLAHAAFGGVALGLLLEAEPLLVALPFTVAIALAIAFVRERGLLPSDTAIGVFYAAAMALGAVFLAWKDSYTAEPMSYLFGDVLLIQRTDLIVPALLLLVTVLLLPMWPRWALATFDRTLAQADGLPVRRDDYLLQVMVAVVIVSAIKLVGILLIAAFLVLPAATARLFFERFFQMTLMALALGTGGVVAGLFVADATNLPMGPVVILLLAGVFVLGLLLRPEQRALA